VPLFRSSQDAIMARLRNSGMLLFVPVALNKQTLDEMVSTPTEFCMINDPHNALSRGSRVTLEELLQVMITPIESTALSST